MPDAERAVDDRLQLALITFTVFVAIYLPELSSFNLSIDEELAAFRTDPAIWIGQGRWGTYIIERWLFQQSTVPYFPTAFFGVSLAASYALIRKSALWRNDPIGWQDVLGFAVFCSFPSWFFIAEFYPNLVSVGVGVICCGLFVYLLAESLASSRFLLAALATAAGVVAVGMYQSFFLALAALGGLSLLRGTSGFRPWHFVATAACLVGSLGGYFIVQRLALAISGQVPSGYVESFLDLNATLSNPVAAIINVAKGWAGAFGLSDDMYIYPAWGFALVLGLGVASLAPRRRRSVFGALVLAATCLSPFALHLLAGSNAIPTRTLVAAPFVAWGTLHMALYSSARWVRTATTVASIIAVVQAIYILSNYQAANRVAADFDRNLAQAIYERVLTDYPAAGRPIYIDVFGSSWVFNPYRTPPTSTVGRSFFDWDLGQARRVAAYMRLVGFTDIFALPQDRVQEFIGTFVEMPNWPAPGSVRVINNVALVRLGGTPDVMHQHLLKEGGQ